MRWLYNFLLIIGLSVGLILPLSGQDIHYSQFFNSPLNLNPALTGMFNGNTRIHANYRQQWASVPVDYVSADIGADFKLRNKKNKNYLGVGALFNYDTAGDLDLQFTGLNGFVSYTINISENKYITPGLNLSFAQRRYDFGNVLSGNQWNGTAFDPGISPELIGGDSESYFDLGLGLNYRGQAAYRKHLDLGIGLYHLIQPEDSFVSNATYESTRPMRLTAYGMLSQPLADRLDLLVNAVYQSQSPYQEVVVNAQGKIYLDNTQNTALYLGLGYRFDDAWYPMIAVEYGRFYGAFSYDFNISNFDVATDGQGGPELALRYIFAKIPDGVYKPCLIY